MLRPAKDSVLQMIQLAKDSLPFSRADAAHYSGRVEHIFSDDGIRNTLAYVQAAAVIGRTTENNPGLVAVTTELGAMRLVEVPTGELVPRIC